MRNGCQAYEVTCGRLSTRFRRRQVNIKKIFVLVIRKYVGLLACFAFKPYTYLHTYLHTIHLHESITTQLTRDIALNSVLKHVITKKNLSNKLVIGALTPSDSVTKGALDTFVVV